MLVSHWQATIKPLIGTEPATLTHRPIPETGRRTLVRRQAGRDLGAHAHAGSGSPRLRCRGQPNGTSAAIASQRPCGAPRCPPSSPLPAGHRLWYTVSRRGCSPHHPECGRARPQASRPDTPASCAIRARKHARCARDPSGFMLRRSGAGVCSKRRTWESCTERTQSQRNGSRARVAVTGRRFSGHWHHLPGGCRLERLSRDGPRRIDRAGSGVRNRQARTAGGGAASAVAQRGWRLILA